MDKPFKTIAEQKDILESRGIIVDEKTSNILLCEGYYSVINGYKNPFLIDTNGAEELFKENTKFSDIHALSKLDRELRSITFKYLAKIECMVRTICCYSFCESYQSDNSYADKNNFSDKEDYLPGEDYFAADFAKLQFRLNEIIYKKTKFPFIEHYKKNHDNVPLWVVSKAMTFGNVEHFYDLMKPREQEKTCTYIVNAIGKAKSSNKLLTRKDLRRYITNLVKIRNICAHDERLYCSRTYGRNGVRYVETLDMMFELMSDEDSKRFIVELIDLILSYQEVSPVIWSTLTEHGLIEFVDTWVKKIQQNIDMR